jgi:hypothetical protein
MSKNSKKNGYTRQGVRDLNYIKGKPAGVRLESPPHEGLNCEHPSAGIRYDHLSGCTSCGKCKNSWDFDGKPI